MLSATFIGGWKEFGGWERISEMIDHYLFFCQSLFCLDGEIKWILLAIYEINAGFV